MEEIISENDRYSENGVKKNSLEIESHDVIRLIQQFLRENNLMRTFETLQEESRVKLNTVENIQTFREDILQGRWDVVLKAIRGLELTPTNASSLYELCIIELIEIGEKTAAKVLLRQTPSMNSLRDSDANRYLHLETILAQPEFIPAHAYGRISKVARREALADNLCRDIEQASPSRLLTLLGQAMRWQVEKEFLSKDIGSYNLFRGAVHTFKAENDAIPTSCYATIQLPSSQHVESAVFSPDGLTLATGSSDGFIELWNPLSGKIRRDLKYQAENKVMGMRSTVLCLAFSRDSTRLASGSQDGQIKIWLVATGISIRNFEGAHEQGVTCLTFSKGSSQILSGGFDGVIRSRGFQSGSLLREFVGHSSFVNSIAYNTDGNRIFSASSDGSVRIWDSKSGVCLLSVFPAETSSVSALQFLSGRGQVLIATHSRSLHCINVLGKIVWNSPKDSQLSGQSILAATSSPHGEYAYALTDDNFIWHICFSSNKVTSKNVGERVIGLASHPLANILVTWSQTGSLCFWRN